MSMEKEYVIHDAHTRQITALGCNPSRRELYIGFDDGTVKSVEADTGALVQTYTEHRGWITAFVHWPIGRLLFCSSNDFLISAIGAGGNLADKIFIGKPVYSMALNNRRRELILAVANSIQFHELNESKDVLGHYLNARARTILTDHVDIVKCVASLESRVYTGGYDGALCIYECQFAGTASATRVSRKSKAHEAGITCLVVEKEPNENDHWILTGSFDRTVRLWSGDGKLVHKVDQFLASITGLCYLNKTKTICAAAGSNVAAFFDPISGENVSAFSDTFAEEALESSYICLLKYISEYSMLLASTSRKQLIAYKHNQNACITSLKCMQTLDSICYTNKAPILFFTADSDANVQKWEQSPSNQIVYTSETLLKSERVLRESSISQGGLKASTSESAKSMSKKTNIIWRLSFVESLDLILAACEDGNIYVWGFDEEADRILKDMYYGEHAAQDEQSKELKKLSEYFASLNEKASDPIGFYYDSNPNESSGDAALYKKKKASVAPDDSSRVFVLKKVLAEHKSSVSSLAIIERADLYSCKFLLSGGWDRRICLWDLDHLLLYDIYRDKSAKSFDQVELAALSSILDVCYCDTHDLFAYSTAESTCYIRKFSSFGIFN
jgi:WD40 repeat protein